ncbi:MAG: nucleotide-diphospho-sugar transferase [Pedobacter sp.]|uniref:nucleotide-diphospho-sugar transferase n=1 Tax=Pedobacter sp. TaxID=1411316 RepID=UPI003569C000
MKDYCTKSPVLFLIFNRPDTTKAVFEEIRNAKPPKLYIAADGPRTNRLGELDLCQQAIAVVNNIDWPCEVKTLYRNENLGCKEAVASAVTWFFDQEEEGIILEDDCLPSKSFFKYCDTLLEKYRFDTRIRHITGCNLHFGTKWGEASVFFSRRTEVWGWASWRRVWQDYDKNLSRHTEEEMREQLFKIFSDPFIVDSWMIAFNGVKKGEIDTWDYQLAIHNYLNNGLSVCPNVSLITNIGFRADATHSTNPNDRSANILLGEIDEITFPKDMISDTGADYAIAKHEFKLEEKWKEHNHPKKQFKRWIKSKFKSPSSQNNL